MNRFNATEFGHGLVENLTGTISIVAGSALEMFGVIQIVSEKSFPDLLLAIAPIGIGGVIIVIGAIAEMGGIMKMYNELNKL